MSEVKNSIPEGWIETTLGETSHRKQYGYTESASFDEIGPKFLRITDIQNDFIDWESVPYCPISDSDLKKYKLGIGDIVIARTGNSTGATATIKENINAVFASYLIRFQLNYKIANFDFIDFLLRSTIWHDFVNSVKSGSAQGGANANDFAMFPIYLPPLPEQKAIAKVLTAFDDKIKNLRAQNDTLEQTARTIFTEWFGKYQIGDLSADMAGELPEGWRVGKLGEVTKICGGTTPSTLNPDFWGGTIYWTSPKDLSNSKEMFLLSTEKTITEKGLKKISSGLLPKKTLLLSSRAPIGYLSITDIELAINQGYIALLANQHLSNQYMYLWLKTFIKVVENAGNGSTFLEISKTAFRSIECIIPEKNILRDFDNLINPLFDKVLSNLNQIQTLSQTRDTLLPKLMSGELRVKGFDRQ